MIPAVAKVANELSTIIEGQNESKTCKTVAGHLLNKLKKVKEDFGFLRELQVLHPSRKGGCPQKLSEFNHLFNSSERDRIQGEFANYLRLPRQERPDNESVQSLVSWWEGKSTEFGELSKLAIHRLSIPCSVAIVESSQSLFSTLTSNRKRTRMSHEAKRNYMMVSKNDIVQRLPPCPGDHIRKKRRKRSKKLPGLFTHLVQVGSEVDYSSSSEEEMEEGWVSDMSESSSSSSSSSSSYSTSSSCSTSSSKSK